MDDLERLLEYEDFMEEGMRESWQKNPAHRYQICHRSLFSNVASYLDEYSDIHTRHMTDLIKAKHSHAVGRYTKFSQIPEAFGAFEIYKNSGSYGGMRWIVEAYIMAGATDEQLQDRIPSKFGKHVYAMYRKCFFDVDDYLDNKLKVMAAIFNNAFNRNNIDSVYDLDWKRMAYDLKTDKFDNYMNIWSGGVIDATIEEHLRAVHKQNLMVNTVHIVQDRRLINERNIGTVQLSQNLMHVPNADTNSLEKEKFHQVCASLVQEISIDTHLIKSDDVVETNGGIVTISPRHNYTPEDLEQLAKYQHVVEA